MKSSDAEQSVLYYKYTCSLNMFIHAVSPASHRKVVEWGTRGVEIVQKSIQDSVQNYNVCIPR